MSYDWPFLLEDIQESCARVLRYTGRFDRALYLSALISFLLPDLLPPGEDGYETRVSGYLATECGTKPHAWSGRAAAQGCR